MSEREAILPCPFCGGEKVETHLDREQGYKWGYAACMSCGARASDVRTGYDTSDTAPWRQEALAEWNRRAAPSGWRTMESARQAYRMGFDAGKNAAADKVRDLTRDFAEHGSIDSTNPFKEIELSHAYPVDTHIYSPYIQGVGRLRPQKGLHHG